MGEMSAKSSVISFRANFKIDIMIEVKRISKKIAVNLERNIEN